jgi:hypothetical protein
MVALAEGGLEVIQKMSQEFKEFPLTSPTTDV